MHGKKRALTQLVQGKEGGILQHIQRRAQAAAAQRGNLARLVRIGLPGQQLSLQPLPRPGGHAHHAAARAHGGQDARFARSCEDKVRFAVRLLQGFQQRVLRLHGHALGIFQQNHAPALQRVEGQRAQHLAQMIHLDGAVLIRAGGRQKVRMRARQHAAAALALHAGALPLAHAQKGAGKQPGKRALSGTGNAGDQHGVRRAAAQHILNQGRVALRPAKKSCQG